MTVKRECFHGERQAMMVMVSALKRTMRARIGFAASGDRAIQNLILDTHLLHYQWATAAGSFPNWEPLMPCEARTTCHLDKEEAVKAIGTLKVLADNKGYALDRTWPLAKEKSSWGGKQRHYHCGLSG